MKHFLLVGQHIMPFEQRDPALIAEHRAFLQKGYDGGHFLLSGPSIPPIGGLLVARAESRDQLDDLLKQEPFTRERVMFFRDVIEFDPVQHQPLLAEWFSGSDRAR